MKSFEAGRLLKRTIIACMCAAFVVTSVPAVSGTGAGMAKVSAATVSKPSLSKSASVTVGYTKKLSVSGTNSKVTWKSSNSKIATVDKNGQVKGKKAGTAKITAKVGKTTLTCTVSVLANARKNLQLSWGNDGPLKFRMTSVEYKDGKLLTKYSVYNTGSKTISYNITDVYVNADQTRILSTKIKWQKTSVRPGETRIMTITTPNPVKVDLNKFKNFSCDIYFYNK